MMTTGSVQPRRGVTSYQQPEGAPRFLSDVIIELGLAAEDHVNQAVETARSSGATVGQILVKERRLSEDDLARALAARYGLAHIDLNEFEVDPEAANLLPPAAARRYKAVPLAFEPDGTLLVAMADPSDSLALSDISFMTHLEVQAAVAAANLISDLVARLPLPPNESGGSRFPTAAPAPPPVVPEPQAFMAPPAPAPAVDNSEVERLRAEVEALAATLDSERSKHAHMVAELRHTAAAEDTKAELDALRAELGGVRGDLERTRSELGVARSERDTARTELDVARGERDAARAERDASRGELEVARTERDGARGELDAIRAERDSIRAELERVKHEASVNAEAGQRAAEAERRAAEMERRLAELGDADQRVAEAHSMVEKIRHEFEIEREEHAATERELRARLASENERHEALQDAHASLQKRVEVLRTQNAALLDAYATAKRWSAEFARGAKELAATLEQPVLDDAVRAQPQPQDKPEEQPGEHGGGGAPPPEWLT